MLRRILLGLFVLGVVALSAYWWLTAPSPAIALAAHTPDLANGQEIFNAGGCTSCHAVPNQEDRLKLGGGLSFRSRRGQVGRKYRYMPRCEKKIQRYFTWRRLTPLTIQRKQRSSK